MLIAIVLENCKSCLEKCFLVVENLCDICYWLKEYVRYASSHAYFYSKRLDICTESKTSDVEAKLNTKMLILPSLQNLA